MTEEELALLVPILESPLKWAEAFLKNPETGDPFVANYVEKQILGCDKDRVVIRVARRTGKSYSLSILAIWACMVHKYYNVVIFCPDDTKVTELFGVIDGFIDSTPVVNEAISESTKSPHYIKFKNGSTIKGKTLGSSSKKEGVGARSLGAHLLILDEAAYMSDGDFSAINAIIAGDKYKDGVRTFAASTPTEFHGVYYSMCKDDSGTWHEIHIPITENPDFTEEDVALRKSLSLGSEREWILEYLAEFIDAGMNAFKNSDIDTAMTDYTYANKGYAASSAYRAMGVDWDKYQAGVNIVIVETVIGQSKYRIIYREEVPRSEYTLTMATERIIALNDSFKPDHIYVDRGYGEQAVEILKLYGKKNPGTKLQEKIKGFNFNENVDLVDPITGKGIKRQFKTTMLNVIFRLFEDKQFEFSQYDKQFEKQLRGYKIIGSGPNTIKTTRLNEHIIDACGLACYALHSNYKDDIKFIPTNMVYVTKPPKVVPSKSTIEKDKDLFSNMKSAFTDKRVYANMGRGSLSQKYPGRSKF